MAYLVKDEAIIADCDVDAANMHLLLKADFKYKEEFFSGEAALIDEDVCINCGKCKEVCRFDAINVIDNQHRVDNISCEGCRYCYHVCPTGAIEMKEQKAGDLFISGIKTGSKMVHAKLGFGAENSGKLVAKVKTTAKELAKKEGKRYIIVDGSPGIGCPVISSLSGANLAVIVTEATVSGLHDLKRVLKLTKSFSLKSICIINKYDLNEKVSNQIEKFLSKENIEVIAKLPYDETFAKALSEAKVIVEYDENCEISKILKNVYKNLQKELK